jgi:hypothetical protein
MMILNDDGSGERARDGEWREDCIHGRWVIDLERVAAASRSYRGRHLGDEQRVRMTCGAI